MMALSPFSVMAPASVANPVSSFAAAAESRRPSSFSVVVALKTPLIPGGQATANLHHLSVGGDI